MTIPANLKRRLVVFPMTIFFLASSPGFSAYAANVPGGMDRSKALVSIHSVNAVGATGDKAGVLGGAAVLFLTKNPTQLVKYSRSGSGVIIDPRGIIVTNAHLVQNAAGISVKLSNGIRLEGRVLRVFPESDIAFLTVRPSFPLSYISLANSDGLVPGDRVYCIGHALDHRGSLLEGKVSATMKPSASRRLHTKFFQIRFGFHLYGGDSGSPILNTRGDLVGLVSAGRRSGDMATLAVASNVIRDAYGNIPKYEPIAPRSPFSVVSSNGWGGS
jgi:S1-C subfamily serine protease